MTRPPHDGRRYKGWLTREAIVAATRRMLTSGNFRPTAKEIGRQDGFSARSVHQHFPTLDDLYLAAIDADTAHTIVSLLPVTDEIALARVIVLGRTA